MMGLRQTSMIRRTPRPAAWMSGTEATSAAARRIGTRPAAGPTRQQDDVVRGDKDQTRLAHRRTGLEDGRGSARLTLGQEGQARERARSAASEPRPAAGRPDLVSLPDCRRDPPPSGL